MAYTNIPRNLSAIKSRFAFGLAGPQILHILAGASVGVPAFFMARAPMGNGPAMLLLFACVAPFAFLALYEKDGQPAKKWIYIILRHKIYPQRRVYKTRNIYGRLDRLAKEEKLDGKQKAAPGGAKRAAGEKRQGRQGQQKRAEKNGRARRP